MGLLPIAIGNKYAMVFGTIGPVQEEWGREILEWIDAYWRKTAVYDPDYPPRLKFEVSNTGYPHFHLGLSFQDRQKYALFCKHLRARLAKMPKPVGYDPKVGYSVRLFAVPCVQEINGTKLRGGALIDAYLDNPVKEKSTAGASLSVEFEGFNAYAFIKECKSEELIERYKTFLKKWGKVDWKKMRQKELDLISDSKMHVRWSIDDTDMARPPELTEDILTGCSLQTDPEFSKLTRIYPAKNRSL